MSDFHKTTCPEFEELSEVNKRRQRLKNNPKEEGVGAYTGRCEHCHSSDLWDDETWYGCKDRMKGHRSQRDPQS